MEARADAMTDAIKWRVFLWHASHRGDGGHDEVLGIVEAATLAEATRLGSQTFGEPEGTLLVERMRLRP